VELHYRREGAGDASVRTVKVALKGEGGRFLVSLEGAPGEAALSREVVLERAAPGTLRVSIGGRSVEALIAEEGARRIVKLEGAPPQSFVRAETRRPRARPRERGAEGLIANMHGQVVLVAVEAGALVERGATLVVIEAMKMELKVTAPHRGRVKSVLCKAGEVVERGRTLVELEPVPE
jgi:3-methylcrotonyl-CoA carboxylase alpha subunit